MKLLPNVVASTSSFTGFDQLAKFHRSTESSALLRTTCKVGWMDAAVAMVSRPQVALLRIIPTPGAARAVLAAAVAILAAKLRPTGGRKTRGSNRSQPHGKDQGWITIPSGTVAAAWAYALLGIVFAASLVATVHRHPLVPFQPSSAAWSFAWLIQTIWDYYATALCLCGIVIATEGWPVGLFWCMGILLLGSSFSCAWISLRLLNRTRFSFVLANPTEIA